MKTKILFAVLVGLLIISLLLASCSKTTSTTAAPLATTSHPVTAVEPLATTTMSVTQANWWDFLGEPQYGGVITWATTSLGTDFDPYSSWGGAYGYYLETLWQPDWKLDRKIWAFYGTFIPDEYWAGCLADSWEQPDAQTIIVHLRQGIYWQNKPPVNGREFTADDVQQHYNRVLGNGSGYTVSSAYLAGRIRLWESVTATDKYTVIIKFKQPTATGFTSVTEQGGENWIEAPEVVKAGGGKITDWTNAVGTGPWMLEEYASGTSATYNRNPDYWGVDERHPQNNLPYADSFKVVAIPDQTTQIAALRTGKIDMLTNINWQQAASLAKTNPELKQASQPFAGQGMDFRIDKTPFTDVRVRKAMNMSIDRPTIAKDYFGGTVEGTAAAPISDVYKDYAYPYEKWSQSLKDEYSYNPAQAKQLLADAGYPQGFNTNVVALSNADLNLAQVVKAYLLDIGINMEIRTMDPIAGLKFVQAKKHDQLYWQDMGTCGVVIAPSILIALRTSKDLGNFTGSGSPEYDALAEKYYAATDSIQAKQLGAEAIKYIVENHWEFITFPIVTYTIYQPYIKGYSGESVSGGGASLMPYARWWIQNN